MKTSYKHIRKQFVFQSDENAIWSRDCLADVGHFLKQLNAEKETV